MFEVHKGENGKEVFWFTKGRGESLKRSRDGDKMKSSLDGDSAWWERRDEYALVGSILGLAIFNDVNLDLRVRGRYLIQLSNRTKKVSTSYQLYVTRSC